MSFLFRKNPAITANLKPTAQALVAMRQHFHNPICVGMCLFSVMLTISGMMPPILPHLGSWVSGLSLALSISVYLILGPWPATWIVHTALKRNIPIVVSSVAFLFFLSFGEVTIYWLAGVPEHTLEELPFRCLRRGIFIIGLQVPYLLYHENLLRNGFGYTPELVPYLIPLKSAKSHPISPRIFGASLEGIVLSIKAQNQYILIQSTAGEELVRKSIGEATEKLPKEAGLRIHRSWWLSASELQSATINMNGKQLTSSNGTVYPIGKTRLEDVQKILK